MAVFWATQRPSRSFASLRVNARLNVTGYRHSSSDAVAEFLLPVCLDCCDSALRQWSERDRLGHILSVFKTPIEELHYRFVGVLGSVFAQDLPSAAGNRPCIGTCVVGKNHVEILCLAKVNVRCRILKAFQAGAYNLAITVDHTSVGHVSLENVGVFNVANGAWNALNVGSYAFVTFATDAGRPRHGGVRGADFGFPLRANFREVVTEGESRA